LFIAKLELWQKLLLLYFMKPTKPLYNNLVEGINELLANGKHQVEKTVNSTMVSTYWHIGEYIVEYEQGGKERAEYGTQLLKRLSEDLTKSFGSGFSYRNLKLIRQFYLTFQNWQPVVANSEIAKGQPLVAQFKNTKGQPVVAQSDAEKLQPVAAKFSEKAISSIPKLSWTHLVRLLSVKNEDERNFYIIETAQNTWSKRELGRQINSSLFERLVLSKDKKVVSELAEKGHEIATHQDLLKDPLVLEFLNIKEETKYSEKELETAIIDNLGDFLLELGKGFTFVARQKRISSASDHFYIDLVFYNRLLRSFVIIDLKIGKLKHQDIGQMQMYVNYYDREVKTESENSTIGIILCKEKDDFVIEYTLPENNKQIFANEYKLYLPNKKEIQKLLENYL
jgi:predicted nuclease of restriction endonuclease-like (RecB) superfamily